MRRARTRTKFRHGFALGGICAIHLAQKWNNCKLGVDSLYAAGSKLSRCIKGLNSIPSNTKRMNFALFGVNATSNRSRYIFDFKWIFTYRKFECR
jgi:hypothetical protein